MKAIILAVLLIAAAPAEAQLKGITCREFATIAGNAAVERDAGVPMDEFMARITRAAAHVLLNDGTPIHEIAPSMSALRGLVLMVYESRDNPRDLHDLAHRSCLRGVLNSLRVVRWER